MAVAISGDVAVVGVPIVSDSALSGSAYVFRFDGTTWIEEQKLTPSDGPQNPNSFFGFRVAAFGDTIVIGANRDNNENGDGSGAAYVFRFNGTTWVEEAKLLASDGVEEDEFGFSVAVFGDAVVVGTIIDRLAPGAAYVYRFDGVNWVEESKLLSSNLQDGDRLGWSVAISGETAVVGAPNFDDARGDSVGAAYVYRFDGTHWTDDARLVASDGAAIDRLGDWSAISGDTILVGTNQADSEAGAVYLYRFNGANWTEVAKLIASDRDSGDSFGVVSVFGDNVLVGAPSTDDNLAIATGAAYVFRAALADCPPCAAPDADNDGEADSTDACPGTLPGTPVDAAGCSITQFCASFDISTSHGRRDFRNADWKNDEPSGPPPRDCIDTEVACLARDAL